MTPNDEATARSRKFIRILGWVATPVGVLLLVTGIIETAPGSGVGWLFIILGLDLLGLGILLLRVLALRLGAPKHP